MWFYAKENELLINLDWVEAYSFTTNELPHHTGKVIFAWGNDPLLIQGDSVLAFKLALSKEPIKKQRALRILYSFIWENKETLIDITEIKAIKKDEKEGAVMFYRTLLSPAYDFFMADTKEWDAIVNEFTSSMVGN
jgi:hypothetical protein